MENLTLYAVAFAAIAAQLTTLSIYSFRRCRRAYSQQVKKANEMVKQTEHKVETAIQNVTATVDQKVQEMENAKKEVLSQISFEERKLQEASDRMVQQILKIPSGTGYKTMATMYTDELNLDKLAKTSEYKRLSSLLNDVMNLEALGPQKTEGTSDAFRLRKLQEFDQKSGTLMPPNIRPPKDMHSFRVGPAWKSKPEEFSRQEILSPITGCQLDLKTGKLEPVKPKTDSKTVLRPDVDQSDYTFVNHAFAPGEPINGDPYRGNLRFPAETDNEKIVRQNRIVFSSSSKP